MSNEKTAPNQNTEVKDTKQINIFDKFAAELKAKLKEQTGKTIADQTQADYIYKQFVDGYSVYFAE